VAESRAFVEHAWERQSGNMRLEYLPSLERRSFVIFSRGFSAGLSTEHLSSSSCE